MLDRRCAGRVLVVSTDRESFPPMTSWSGQQPCMSPGGSRTGARCRERVSSRALSIARWVHSSLVATFPAPASSHAACRCRDRNAARATVGGEFRDARFYAAFQRIIDDAGLERVVLPPRSPNLNAYAERWVRSVKDEALWRMILFGENSLWHVLNENWLRAYKRSVIADTGK